MSLRKLYELKMTPQRKVEAFRRYVAKLKRQRWGQNASYYGYMRVNTAIFRQEAFYMKGLDVEYDIHVRITKEVYCLEEMTDEQILCYYTLVKRFQQKLIERINIIYVKYYILELANRIYQDTPQEACQEMFLFWELLNKNKKLSNGFREYYNTVCCLLMVEHQELIPMILQALEEKNGENWSGNSFLKIEKGDYQEADRYVRQNARLLKEEELQFEEEYVRHTWEAMPCVFRMLDRRLQKYNFRHVLLGGFYTSTYLNDYPLIEDASKKGILIHLTKYAYLERQEYNMAYWRRWHYVLHESVRDLLNVIHLYTESYMRKYFLVKNKRKRSVQRILNKAYASEAYAVGAQQQNLAALKAMLADAEFESAIHDAVLEYFADRQVELPHREEKPSREKKRRDMDYEPVVASTAIDRGKLEKARADAESVLDLLTEGEIDYEGSRAKKGANEKSEESPRHEGQPLGIVWTEAERAYLRLLKRQEADKAGEYLRRKQIPENIMVKNINGKALELWDDILLEKESGQIRILEDYEKEVEDIVTKGRMEQ